jgi:hypothetical protein
MKVNGELHAPTALTPGEMGPGTHWWEPEKRKSCPSGNPTQSIQPVPRPYAGFLIIIIIIVIISMGLSLILFMKKIAVSFVNPITKQNLRGEAGCNENEFGYVSSRQHCTTRITAQPQPPAVCSASCTNCCHNFLPASCKQPGANVIATDNCGLQMIIIPRCISRQEDALNADGSYRVHCYEHNLTAISIDRAGRRCGSSVFLSQSRQIPLGSVIY